LEKKDILEKLNLDELTSIIGAFKDTDITEFSLKENNKTISIKKNLMQSDLNNNDVITNIQNFNSDIVEEDINIEEKKEDDNIILIKSEWVGTFYSTLSSDVVTTVSVGDKIEKNQKIGMVDTIGIEHIIKAPSNAIIKEILVSDGYNVEYNQDLFKLEKMS
jgi:acetyl-CoA carboxylase biotin carboxyl carrier protein